MAEEARATSPILKCVIPQNSQTQSSMFKKHFFVALLLISVSSVAHAQTDCQDTYDRESIYLRTDFWHGLTFVKAATPHRVGLFLNQMTPEFEKSSAAFPLFRKSQRTMKISFAVGLLGVGGAVVGGIQATKMIDRNGNITDQRRFERNLGMALASALLSTAVTLPLNLQARQHLDDAVWLRNRDVLR